MPINIVWDNTEKTTMRYDFEGGWTWEEFYPAMQQGVEMRQEVTHTVNIIVNLEKSLRIPNNVLTHLKRLATNDRGNRGMIVLAGGGGFVIALVRIYTSLFKSSQRFVKVTKSVDEARDFLKALESTSSE